MEPGYFEKYFNDTDDRCNMQVNYLELCDHDDIHVVWGFSKSRLYINYHGEKWYFLLDRPSGWPFKISLRRVIDSADDVEWNVIGNPIKTKLLAHLRQLNELDGSLTKLAK